MSVALFAGSFNPFTIGHASVVERALSIFDSIIIAVGKNTEKENCVQRQENNESAIRAFCSRFPEGKLQVVTYTNELTVDLAHRLGADCLLRGVRSVKDFEYEREMADVNRRIGHIDTVILFALPEHESVSSSIVRELKAYGRDVSEFLPDYGKEV